jgi:hypothetical protein
MVPINYSSLPRRLVIGVALLGFLPAAGQSFDSGAGLPHSRPAWVLDRGHLTTRLQSRLWGISAEQRYAPYGAAGRRTIREVQSSLALNYGLGAHLEAQITPILYQSDQQERGQFGHDISLGLTAGSVHWPGKNWSLGTRAAVVFPSGLSHNLLFEPYSPDSHAFSLAGLASYTADPEFPAESMSGHLNLGYTVYDDVGLTFTDIIPGTESYAYKRSQNLVWSAGLSLPGDHFDFGLEGYGLIWLHKPPAGAEGREDFLYGSLSSRYKPLRWLHLFLALNGRLSPATDETQPSMAARGLGNLPNYPGWSLQVGLDLKVLPLHVIESRDRDLLIKHREERAPVFEKIIDDGSRMPANKNDLDRLREERERAEKELERLRRIIETRQQEGEPKPDQNL